MLRQGFTAAENFHADPLSHDVQETFHAPQGSEKGFIAARNPHADAPSREAR
jgi:hypothetical protein